jgi:CBS domain-containing protein
MNAVPPRNMPGASHTGDTAQVRFWYFTELLKKPVCTRTIKDRIGKLTDLVFTLREPYPEAVGIFMEFGWGHPTQFIPWDRLVKIEKDAIFVKPPESGEAYPPFVDQPGWMLLEEHLMGRTILDIDGRRTEVVNDAHLLESKGRLVLVHVDTSFNGVLRRWGLGGLKWIKDDFISWKFVQPLSVEDASSTDKVSLSLTRWQLRELPSEDLADVLEELSGKEQEALFSALDPEKAAETLIEAEPRARRQIIADLRKERTRQILGEMSIAQIASLISVLPHDHAEEMLKLVSADNAGRVKSILSEHEIKARDLMDSNFMTFAPTATVGEVLKAVRGSGREHSDVTYLYVVGEDGKTLTGVVDLRDLVLAEDSRPIGELMASPVVAVEEDDTHDDVAQVMSKYLYRMIPVVDRGDRILGIVRYNEIMKGLTARN